MFLRLNLLKSNFANEAQKGWTIGQGAPTLDQTTDHGFVVGGWSVIFCNDSLHQVANKVRPEKTESAG